VDGLFQKSLPFLFPELPFVNALKANAIADA
jgi:hypothetical protein